MFTVGPIHYHQFAWVVELAGAHEAWQEPWLSGSAFVRRSFCIVRPCLCNITRKHARFRYANRRRTGSAPVDLRANSEAAADRRSAVPGYWRWTHRQAHRSLRRQCPPLWPLRYCGGDDGTGRAKDWSLQGNC